MNDIDRVRQLAERLMLEGFVDNEPDAQLVAIQIVIAAEASPSDRGSDDDG
jgi:acylphosphatase